MIEVTVANGQIFCIEEPTRIFEGSVDTPRRNRYHPGFVSTEGERHIAVHFVNDANHFMEENLRILPPETLFTHLQNVCRYVHAKLPFSNDALFDRLHTYFPKHAIAMEDEREILN